MMDRNYKNCEGCKYYGELVHSYIGICNAPQSRSDHNDYWKYRDLLFTKNCPLRECNEFIYWS